MKKKVSIKLECREFPGKVFDCYPNVHVGVQRNREIVDETPGDASSKSFQLTADVSEGKDGSPNFTGPFVHGKTGDKFLYLVWFEKNGAVNTMFRRAKIKLNHFTWEMLGAAIEKNEPLKAIIRLTDGKGGPVCATLKSDLIRWV